VLRELLSTERAGDGILGEEYGTSGDAARQWIIDPIDGTANYLKGIPMWTTLIALAIDGVPRVGVASQPPSGDAGGRHPARAPGPTLPTAARAASASRVSTPSPMPA
jgi:fructose-1,6-bisphosphatase/inositol monophosphatase family enzyme